MAEKANTHVLLFPFPIQGHVSPMLKLSELLWHAGLHITFINTEKIQERLASNSPALFNILSQRPKFRFRTLPDGVTTNDPQPWVQILDFAESMRARCQEPYRELLAPKNGQNLNGWPPVTCVVGDGVFPLPFEVAEEMAIPVILLRTSSACSLWAYYSIPELIERGELPFSEEDDMDSPVQGVAGMESFLRRRDLPGLLRYAKSSTDRGLEIWNANNTNLTRAKALILNTIESLEAPVLSRIRSICPITYTVGPLDLLVKNLDASTDFPSFWQQDRSCMTWLNCQPNKSVVYVSFGSITIMSRDKLLEFWHGLVNSNQRFLWVARPDLVQDMSAPSNQMIPEELKQGTKERGCFVSWAPQEEVLAHPAVGCFLTHSGWNSTLESIVAGVPMICWPFFADQQINSRFVSEIWKIGLDMKDVCERSTIERMVRKVMMDGDEKLRKSICKMAAVARKSTEEGGSSQMNFQKLVQHISCLSNSVLNQ